jgi:hypothetical protein
VRTLPLRLAPIEGESLPGYVARYAHTFQFQPGDLILALGLDHGTGRVKAAGRYGVSLSAEQLARVSFVTGIATDTLEGMLLSHYAGQAFPRSALETTPPLMGPAQRHEVLIWTTRFCPACLREDGAWRLAWQLGWGLVCQRHQALLARHCPECGGVPTVGPRGIWQQDDQGLLSDPGCCTHRVAGRLCRAPLAAAESVDVTANSALIAAQHRVDAILVGQLQPMLVGVVHPPEAYLGDLRWLCGLLDRYARLAADGAPRERVGRRPYHGPAEVAAVLPEALALIELRDPDALVDALRELANRRYRARGQTLPAANSGAMSEHLKALVQRAASQAVWAPASRRLGLHPNVHRRPEDLDPRLAAEHVPQLFWEDDYSREIHELFDYDQVSPRYGRRFCSVLLARILTPLTWHAAVRYLDYPEQFINAGYNTTFVALRSHGRFDELAARVKRIANQHARGELIDYRQRRVRLAGWRGIDIESWHLLKPRPRPRQPHLRVDSPVPRARASVWLWCHLTSGHERAAPIPLPARDALVDQARFTRHGLRPVRERLLILGELLLDTPADAHSTLHNRLAGALHRRGHLASNFYLDTLDPLITSRVLAHVSAHTGVDIPSLTTPSPGSKAPPAVTHARLLTATLLRRTALASWNSIAAVLGGEAKHLGENDRRYKAALAQQRAMAAELDQLLLAIESWHNPAPSARTTPHRQRMHDLAIAIKTRATELLASSHGVDAARRASIACCQQLTDLTRDAIAAVHGIKRVEPPDKQATVSRHRQLDHDFDQRYRQLLDQARELQRGAGYGNTSLRRGLATIGRTRASGRGPK